MSELIYSFEKAIPPQKVVELFRQTDWAARRGRREIARMLEHTSLCLGVWKDEQLIGFARVLTDHTYRALIEDVIVDRRYRNDGIGQEMLSRLTERLKDVEEILLGCSHDLIPFYEKFGFTQASNPHMKMVKPQPGLSHFVVAFLHKIFNF